jgi:hypothetical protein
MKNKSILLLGFASLVIITASSFQLLDSKFKNHQIEKNACKNAKFTKTDFESFLTDRENTNKPVIASLTNQGVLVNNSTKILAPNAKPNILLFIADDMTSIDCEPYGNKDVHTPNLTKLANEGLLFDNMNNATAMCGPTRQSLYTGLFQVKNGSYPNHSQVYDNIV